jgi:transposase-like protein
VTLEALRGDKTVQEITAKRPLHPTQVSTWKRQAIEGMAGVFSDNLKKAGNKGGEIKELHARIGELAVKTGAEAYMAAPRSRSPWLCHKG